MVQESYTGVNQKECGDLNELISYKYLLGDFGIQILASIARGASNCDSIVMLSGVPVACVTGRIPVLKNLKLIDVSLTEIYSITEKGLKFLKCINEIV